jgi:hypothetical protein
MKKVAILVAVDEAKRFLAKAEDYLEREKNDKYADMGCKESGAVRRSSLDLTRTLADMRRQG